MLRAVIFDMDGVLADSHSSHTTAWRKLLLLHGKQMMESHVELVRSGRKREELLRWFLGDLTSDQIRTCGQEKDAFFQEEMGNITAIAGVRELLCELSRAAVPMAVASCGSRPRVHQTLDLLQVNQYFQVVVTGDDVTRGKPDPEIYCKAAAHLGVQPAESLVFEDSVSGVLAATVAGMKSVGIADPWHAQSLLQAGAVDAVPDFVGVSFRQMRQFFSLKSNNEHHETSSHSPTVR
jgi:HAD superfamily hydrolase (TIGR01509 family)